MNMGWAVVLLLSLCFSALAQADSQQRMLETDRAFGRLVAEKGIKSAYLEYLSDDSVVFRPNPTNGREFWKATQISPTELYFRSPTYTDIASNGMLGYTTGSWQMYTKGRTDAPAKVGQYVTIWERKLNGDYRATLDMTITHEALAPEQVKRITPAIKSRDANKNGWSAADASMKFLKLGMTEKTLGGAYKEYAAEDVRLLIEREPPIKGKKAVVSAAKKYTSINYPENVSLFEAGDMAYVWNPCEYQNSLEGREKGNCLHVWKLRDEKWWIVLGVFAREVNDARPELKRSFRDKKASKQ